MVKPCTDAAYHVSTKKTYQMIVSIEELGKTSLYPEIINTITRGDASAAELQILAAEELVKSYLTRYDLTAIFGDGDTAPTYNSELVKKCVKIIASYYLVRLANPNVDLELFRKDYEDCLTLLADIRDGKNDVSLPYAQDDPETPEDESNPSASWSSNPKRTNHF